MKKIKFGLGVILAIGCANIISPITNVLGDESNINDEEVKVFAQIEFTNDEMILYKESMIAAFEETKEDLEQNLATQEDELKEEILQEELYDLNKLDVESIFTYDIEQDKYIIEVPIKNTEMIINDEPVSINQQGNLDTSNLTSDDLLDISTKANLSSNETTVEFDNDVYIKQSFETFAEGIQSMEDNMSETQGQAQQVFYAKKAVGEYLGNGAGRSKVFFNTNIVGCNKHDKNTNSINTAQFAIQNSDYSKSVKLGLA